jgi:hypothetical protein
VSVFNSNTSTEPGFRYPSSLKSSALLGNCGNLFSTVDIILGFANNELGILRGQERENRLGKKGRELSVIHPADEKAMPRY